MVLDSAYAQSGSSLKDCSLLHLALHLTKSSLKDSTISQFFDFYHLLKSYLCEVGCVVRVGGGTLTGDLYSDDPSFFSNALGPLARR